MTLIEISAFFPQTIESMNNIYGIGEEKLKKYGFIFLEIICEYCEKHSIDERPKEIGQRKRKTSKQTGKLRHVVIGEEYNAGESIEKIMVRYNIKLVTVLDHLLKYCLASNKVRSDGLLSVSALSQKEIQAVLKTFDRLSPEYLSPIFKEHNGNISYEDLKIIRLYYLSEKPSQKN